MWHSIYPSYSDMRMTCQSTPYTLFDTVYIYIFIHINIIYVYQFAYFVMHEKRQKPIRLHASNLRKSEAITMHHCAHLLHPRPLWNNLSGPEKTCQTKIQSSRYRRFHCSCYGERIRSCTNWDTIQGLVVDCDLSILLMDKILHQLIGSLSHHLQG